MLDDALIARAMKLTGAKTKRDAMDTAPRRLVRTQEAFRRLEAPRGKLRGEGDLGTFRPGGRLDS